MTDYTQLAIDQVEQHANPDWLSKARDIVFLLASSGRPLTTDDVWDELAKVSTATHEPRALGSVIRNASRLGVIRLTGNYVKTRRREAHSRPIPEWIAA
jgi:hypothetical protein